MGALGTPILYGNALTTTFSSGSASVTMGLDTFAINPHSSETFTARRRTNETFAFGAGFGRDTIAGFLATGVNHDLLQLSASMFGFATSTSQKQQIADARALLSDSSFVSGTTNTVTTDQGGDLLTLNGVTLATLKAHLADFKFT